jgi:hypothetical protein
MTIAAQHNGTDLTLVASSSPPKGGQLLRDEDSVDREDNGLGRCSSSGTPRNPPAPALQLSPARAALSQAIAGEAAARNALDATVKKHNEVERRLPDTGPITARIAEIEAEHAQLAAEWVLAGAEAAVPEPPHQAELEKLKADLSRAAFVRAGVQVALSKLIDEIRDWQFEIVRATTARRDAVARVVEEGVAELHAELKLAEQRVAELRKQIQNVPPSWSARLRTDAFAEMSAIEE